MGTRPSSIAFPISEKEFLQTIRDLARICGWWVHHQLLPMGSPAGLPDLLMVRRDRIIYAELKNAKGKLSPKQEEVMELLRATGKVEVYLWRPGDEDFDEIVRTLC